MVLFKKIKSKSNITIKKKLCVTHVCSNIIFLNINSLFFNLQQNQGTQIRETLSKYEIKPKMTLNCFKYFFA